MTRGDESAGSAAAFEKNLELLVLFRLASSSTAPGRSDLAKALAPFARGRMPEDEWRSALDRALDALASSGEISVKPARITATGMARVQAALELRSPPKVKNWADFKRRYLCAFVLGRPNADGRSLDPLNEVLARALGVDLPPKATLTRLLDAWLAQKLGLEAQPITLSSLRAELLARELGVPRRAKSSLSSTVKIAAAKAANSAKSDPQSLVDALTADWLRDALPALGHAPPHSLAPSLVDGVVRKVKAVLGDAKLRRFGPNKVFVASLWETLKSDPELSALDEHGFKRALVEAHRLGSLELARADLVSAMDPHDVQASEISHLNATYHFVYVPAGPA